MNISNGTIIIEFNGIDDYIFKIIYAPNHEVYQFIKIT